MTSFGTGPSHTLGVEEEFFLVEADGSDPVSRSDAVVEAAPEARSKHVQYEFYRCVVETATEPCRHVDGLREEIHDLRRLVADLAADADARPAATATHPTALVDEAEVTPKPRYQETVDLVGWTALWELVCGQHVHVSVPSEEDAILVHNRVRTYTPHLLALSANSPFWEGEATGYMSSRLPVWDGMPRAGLPRAFDDWVDFQATLDVLVEAGVVEDVTRLWWDVRPRPDLGTVEVRVPDMPTPAEDSLALAGFVQALVARLCQARRDGEDLPPLPRFEVIEENRDRAQREGAQARFIRPTRDGVEEETVAEAVERLLAFLGDVPDELGAGDAVDRVRTIAKAGASGADRQLAVRDRAGSFEAVVDDIARRTIP